MASQETSADMSPMALASDWIDYLIDAAQRTILVTDVLRHRGNQYVEHTVLGRPPVLTFDYDLVRDGRTLPDPVNYLLLKIRSDPAHPIDPKKRPIVVVDPRAGHGPGIGGFKPDSQVGLAVRNGYPCYFVSFLPEPVPGQTLEDVARAEASFLEEVIALHPQAEDRPAVIGNCQAGWAVAILSSVAPELMSIVILNGAPLSYWAGEIGHNPMRYLGGLLGGAWLASLASDLGNGRFDGANLVANFEMLDPANTFWKKPYNLYANVDTEGPRFLEFERWWGGYFLLNKGEMRSIVEDLFIGNRLAAGDITGSGGANVQLRAIKAPIVVFCSKGDNITPPQQALDWILDVYADVDDIRANGQVIIYLLHETIGHLGIFVSSKVAKREHRAIIDSLDVIDALPPGLYEMQVDRADSGEERGVHFLKRSLDDIRALGGARREEAYFLPVAAVSQMNSQFYDTFVSPWIQATSSETAAELQRRDNPTRARRYAFSDMNPLMSGVREAADFVRQWRRPIADDNLFRRAERMNGDLIVEWFDRFRDWRDRWYETAFFATYMPLRAAMLSEERAWLDERAQRLASRQREAQHRIDSQVRPRMYEGGVMEAVMRIALYLNRRRPVIDAQRFRLAEALLKKSPRFANLDNRSFRKAVAEQFQFLMIDEAAAINALRHMITTEGERRELLSILDGLIEELGGLDPDQTNDLEYVRELLSESEAGEPAAAPPQARQRRAKPGQAPLH